MLPGAALTVTVGGGGGLPPVLAGTMDRPRW